MRQVCPHCLAAVEVPASAAGGDVECPVCRRPITVPRSYTPSVDPAAVRPVPAAPAPPPDRPVPPPGFIVGPRPAAAPTGEYTHTRGLSLSATFCDWLPVAGLTLIFILTFFAWVVIAPGGYRGYAQSPWGSLFADMTPDPVVDSILEAEKPLREHLHSTWVFLLPYLVLLVALTILAWVERLFESSKQVAMPSPLVWIEPVWPYRIAALTVGAGVLLFLIAIQAGKGFGLESAAAEAAKLPGIKEKLEAADTSAKKRAIEIEAAKVSAYLTPEGTTARAVAIWLHIFVLLALLGRVWLARRENQPPPRVEVKW
jgi:hypothetical protein